MFESVSHPQGIMPLTAAVHSPSVVMAAWFHVGCVSIYSDLQASEEDDDDAEHGSNIQNLPTPVRVQQPVHVAINWQ